MRENVPVNFRAASWRSPGLTMWYRSSTARDLHGHVLRHATIDHVPHGLSAEVVPEHPEQALLRPGQQFGLTLGPLLAFQPLEHRLPAGRFLGLPEVLNALPLVLAAR